MITILLLLVGLNLVTALPVISASRSIGDNVILLGVLSFIGIGSLIGACALCFRRKRKFEKFENENAAAEDAKKNEYPIFRALSSESANEASAIVACSPNNLSRDNLLNSSDNLTTPESPQSLQNSDVVIDTTDIILVESNNVQSSRYVSNVQSPAPALREKSINNKDTIKFETEKHLVEKKHCSSSSSTPLLYANNAQSYQQPQAVLEQLQQHSQISQQNSSPLLTTAAFSGNFYSDEDTSESGTLTQTSEPPELDEIIVVEQEVLEDCMTSLNDNPFLNSISMDTVQEGESQLFYDLVEGNKMEPASLSTFVDVDKIEPEDDIRSDVSTISSGEANSIEEALRELDIAIGESEEDDMEPQDLQDMQDLQSQQEIPEYIDANDRPEMFQQVYENYLENVFNEITHKDNVKERALELVEYVIEESEHFVNNKQVKEDLQIVTELTPVKDEINATFVKPQIFETSHRKEKEEHDELFDSFTEMLDSFDHMITSTPCIRQKFAPPKEIDSGKALFEMPDDESMIQSVNNLTVILPTIKIDRENEEVCSEDLTTVTPVNTPSELNYCSETWDKMVINTSNTGAISKKVSNETFNKTEFIEKQEKAEESADGTFTVDNEGLGDTFNTDGWYLHPKQQRSDTFDVLEDEEENEEEDMEFTYDQLRKQLAISLPHAIGVGGHSDFMDDEQKEMTNKETISPGEHYGIQYGNLDEASNAGCFENVLEGPLNENVTEKTINYNQQYKRALSPIMEESEDETVRTFVFNNETKLLDSTSTGCMESADGAVMGVAKALMASNDTLFNFEDTLGDGDNANLLLSPRMHVRSAASSTSSPSPRPPQTDRTPTNDSQHFVTEIFNKNHVENQFDAVDIMRKSIKDHPLDLTCEPSTSKYDASMLQLINDSVLSPPELAQIVCDLSSPEQNRTSSFSADLTYTIDDQKTCVSMVLKNDDDERLSETSEPVFASQSFDDFEDDEASEARREEDFATSFQDDELGSLEVDGTLNESSSFFGLNETVLVDQCYNDKRENSITPTPEDTGIVSSKVNDSDVENLNEIMKICSAENSMVEMVIYSPEDPKNRLTNLIDFEGSHQGNGEVNSDEDMPELSLLDISFTTDAESQNTKQTSQIVNVADKSDAEVQSGTSTAVIVAGKASQEAQLADQKQSHNYSKQPAEPQYEESLVSFNHYLLHDFFNHVQDEPTEYSNFTHLGTYLTGEEDWDSATDIRVNGDNDNMLTTSFNEWSDDEGSNSSEEFLYVKGDSQEAQRIMDHTERPLERLDEEQGPSEITDSVNPKESDDQMWKPHEDQVAVTAVCQEEENQIVGESDDDDVSEGDFIASCWNASATPVRSALKSPDKASEIKKRRSVAFKVQRYHSVYEYPCEVIELSPAYSEPQLWSNLDDSNSTLDYFNYAHQHLAQIADFTQEIDGFTVSSSNRPFHSGAQFLSPQCHNNTWPNDATDFSWSQVEEPSQQENSMDQFDQQLEGNPTIEWPVRKSECLDYEIISDNEDEFNRPDSGVGESAEHLTESPSLGELCHTKGSLRLPLDLVSSVSSSPESDAILLPKTEIIIEICDEEKETKLEHPDNEHNIIDDETEVDIVKINNAMLPTPSCTGSMDSLSSSSASSSDRQSSFTTFGKHTKAVNEEKLMERTSIVFIEDDLNTLEGLENANNTKNLHEEVSKKLYYSNNKHILGVVGNTTRLSDSTDEDSGFENITKLTK